MTSRGSWRPGIGIGCVALMAGWGCTDRATGTPDACASECDGPADSVPPGDEPSVFLTVNEIPPSMNGSEPFTALDGRLHHFTLALPPSGFTVDVTATAGDDPVDWTTLSVTCDAALGGGARAAGAQLAGLFAPGDDDDGYHWRVEASLAFPETPVEGAVECSASVRDTAGREAIAASLSFTVAAPTAELLPFDDQDTWVLDFTRDRFSVTGGPDPDTGDFSILSVDGANGIPDYVEEMLVVGFQGNETAPGAATLVSAETGETGVNAILARRLRNALLARVRGFFHQAPDGSRDDHSVPFDLVLDDDPGAPDLGAFSRDGTFSIMGMGGEGRPEDRENFYGKAELDPRNEVRNDNSRYGLGVFTTTAIRALLAQPLVALAMSPFIPELGGVAIGDDPADPIFLADDFDPDAPGVDPDVVTRAEKFTFLFDQLIKAWGALTAHEIGHSLGLVADGPPPTGLFGGEENAEFAGPLTTPAHLDVDGLNIMASGGGGAGLEGGLAAMADEPFFTALELAYLRSRLWVLPGP